MNFQQEVDGIAPPNYTQIPNAVLDRMHEMSEVCLRVVMAVCRQTFGWQKQRDRLSLTQLQRLTGLSRQGVLNGIAEAEDSQVLQKTPISDNSNAGFYYSIRVVNTVDQSTQWTTSSQHSRPQVVNTVDTQNKDLNKSKERERNAREVSPPSSQQKSSQPQSNRKPENASGRNGAEGGARGVENDGYRRDPFIEGADDARFRTPHFLAVCDACQLEAAAITHSMKTKVAVAAVTLYEQGYTPEQIRRCGEMWPHATAPYPSQIQNRIKAILNRKDVKTHAEQQNESYERLAEFRRRCDAALAAQQTEYDPYYDGLECLTDGYGAGGERDTGADARGVLALAAGGHRAAEAAPAVDRSFNPAWIRRR